MASNTLPHQKQLENFKASQQKTAILTTSNGAPIYNKSASLTVGPRGPMLLQDVQFLDELAHFDRERIPERVVHAKGAGAHGYFEVTNDITKYCKAALFNKIGKQTPLFIRFSTVGGEMGSADTARDVRGFAVKFYTDEGNWDLVGINTPVFFINDPILFPNFVHTQKRNPVTHLKDPNMTWDFFSLRPETTHQVMVLYSDRGIPDGYRHMNGYGAHTYKLVNDKGEAVYCKFHMKTEQGIRNISANKAQVLAGADPDYSIRDLYDNIESGKYPSWKFYIQVMTFEEAEKCPFNPFDLTKVWPHKDYPLIPVGKVTLNRNPKNYFAEVEQSAFAPSHVVPGIEFSPDKMLQGRIFAYTDTQFHRLGPNYVQIPVNCPFLATATNTQRDGTMMVNNNQEGMPNYHPNSFNGAVERSDVKESTWVLSGTVDRYNPDLKDNYVQPKEFWTKVLDEAARNRLIENIVNDLKTCYSAIQDREVENLKHVHMDFGNGVRDGIQKWKQEHDKQQGTKKAFDPKEDGVMQLCLDERMANVTNIEKYVRY